MGRNKLSNEEKTRALTLLKEGASVIRVAAEVNVTRMAIYNLKKAVESLPPGTVPPRKPGSGAPQKTSPRTDKIMRREVLNDPAITAAELKKKHPALLGNVSVRTIQHRLQISLKLPTRRAAKKPLLTEAMRRSGFPFVRDTGSGHQSSGRRSLVMKALLDGLGWFNDSAPSSDVTVPPKIYREDRETPR
ncbi:hypothetical protein GWK47_005654 [Chionoecetes opilio]|uniref:Uncharacterized protein n=1 Tax=Chionoecetes opilio TaxID=41210 RepID=A0A8J5CW21_CHIOP|nr:hypothetical protein GWK47_005654 [Chionoecetes opilio]